MSLELVVTAERHLVVPTACTARVELRSDWLDISGWQSNVDETYRNLGLQF